jgi:hypothetical protein
MAYSCFCSINVCIHCLFMVFAPDFMIPPNVFRGRDGFAMRHGIRTFCHSFALGWELTRNSAPIPY